MPKHTHSITSFVVEGGRSAEFPLDMLRYDSAWPESEHDATTIRRELTATDPLRKRVLLNTASPHAPTIARWESFGWKVIAAERYGTRHDELIGVRNGELT